jgi:hypothetical protein
MQNHPDPEPAQYPCEICQWTFGDPLALETHRTVSGHGAFQFECDNCDGKFITEVAYNKHRKFPSPCSDAFKKKKSSSSSHTMEKKSVLELTEPPPNKILGYVDVNATALVTDILQYDDDEQSLTPTEVSGIFCHVCKGSFESQADFDRHMLRCSTGLRVKTEAAAKDTLRENIPPVKAATHEEPTQPAQSLAEASQPLQAPTAISSASHQAPSGKNAVLKPAQPTQKGTMLNQLHGAPPVSAPRGDPPSSANKRPPPLLEATPKAVNPVLEAFVCNSKGCQTSYRTEAALKVHQAAVHGLGRQTAHGKNKSTFNTMVGKQLMNHGLLRAGTLAPQGSRGSREALRNIAAGRPPPRGPQAMSVVPPAATTPNTTDSPLSIGGPAEYEQAQTICGKILRLRIQNDISIQHDGKMLCGGMAWTRIGVAKQPDVVGMFEKLTHLPRKFQTTEYLPPPKTFKAEYDIYYPASDFQNSPSPISTKPGMSIVAISCSKILLDNGRQEVIRIAAVDVLSCRILMNYLVSTDTKASVKDWRTSVTGLSSFGDIEAARLAGYKILKGWQAARAALWKFIDSETIIVGYNLRGDLDALRMIHGRAIDIAKSVEKAAGGPLSKQQLSLDSLCRDYPQVLLTTDATYGRDCLLNAFAIREFGLWMLKQGDQLVRKAKQKSLEYQLVHPTRG